MANISEIKATYDRNRQIIWDTPLEITCAYLDAYCENKNDAPILREAKALYNFWGNSLRVFVFPEDKICGFTGANEVAGFSYGGGTWIDWEKAEKYIAQESLDAEGERAFRDKLQILEDSRYKACREEDYTPEEMRSIRANAATSTWFGGHIILDNEQILKIGLGGYQDKLDMHRGADFSAGGDFYDALEIMLDAVRAVIRKFADAAHKPEMRADLLHIAQHPPQTLTQAMQLVWILHMLNGSDSFGRFDFYLKPFFDRDIAQNKLTAEQAYDLVLDFWCKLDSVGAIQNMTVGGADYDGEPVYSLLTAHCIQATRELGFKGPNLCLRVTEHMPEHIWDAALECMKTGLGLPALYNDALITSNLLKFGYDIKDARNHAFAGCSQLMIPGVCNFINDIGMVNAAKIAEISLHDGFDPRTGEQVGPHTGKPEHVKDFAQLLQAYKAQLDYFCQLEVDIHEKERRYRLEREGYAMRTLFVGDCIENGRNVFDGGARFNSVELEIIGITNAADHLYAIKELVFEQQLVSLPELAQILKNNWQGREDLRSRFLKADKFGNDCEQVDAIRADIAGHIYSRFNSAKSAMGGTYIPGEVIFTAHGWCGELTGATADGRLAYSVLADSAGASQGLDLNGPTALLNSVLKLPADSYLTTNIITNIKFTPELFGGALDKIKALFEIFFRRGGMQLQVNVCDAETLHAAQANPREYASLIVRVGGYSDYFVHLPQNLQDEIIARTAQSV